MKKHSYLKIIILLTSILGANQALANYHGGLSYFLSVKGQSVEICVDCSSVCEDQCKNDLVVLRENVATGEVVSLSNFCVESNNYIHSQSCFLDECVPPANYRYGLEEIDIECAEEWFFPSAPLYEEVSLLYSSESCTLSAGNPGTKPYNQGAPWLEYSGGNLHLPPCEQDDPYPGSTCSVANVGAETVLSVNMAIFGLGMFLSVLMRRKRKK